MPRVPFKEPLKFIEIRLMWEDGIGNGSNGFKTVQDFAQFLKDNPELAKAVKYEPKHRR